MTHEDTTPDETSIASTGRLRLREATAADVAQVAPFFRAIVEDGETYAYPSGLRDAQIADLWFESTPGRTTVVVESDGEGERVLGTAKMRPNRPGRGSHVGTASFMVEPSAAGRGIGRLLATDMIEWHRREGYRAIQFNAVVETNTAAVRLWRDLGFEILTTVPEAFDSRRYGLVGLHVMFLRLEPGTQA